MSSQSLVRFGPFIVTSQVFLRTPLSFGLVNLKPILPGHVLVCPNRVTGRLSDLSAAESTDFYSTVQRVARAIETEYKADALNIAIQDGPLAGQTVPHVHCHIIPRRLNDLDNIDQIYELINSKQGDLAESFRIISEAGRTDKAFTNPDATRSGPRSEEVMVAEAQRLAKLFTNAEDN